MAGSILDPTRQPRPLGYPESVRVRPGNWPDV